jgi:hypothetical protein
MRYARGSRESDEEDVPAASKDEDDPAYDPESGEESEDEAGGGRPVANPAGRAPRNPLSLGGVLLPKGRATDLLLSHTKAVSTQPARGFNIFIQGLAWSFPRPWLSATNSGHWRP